MDAKKTANIYTAVANPNPEAIVIWCSDPRFQEAILGFIATDLKLEFGQYVPFTVAGGPGTLGRPMELPKEFKFIKDRLELFHEHFKSIKRVIIINHEDCAYYKKLARAGELLTKLQEHCHASHDDMGLLKQIFNSTLKHLGVELDMYYARFTDETHTRVSFEHVL